MAPAWKEGAPGATAAAAAGYFDSGKVLWGLDEGEEVFAAFGVPYQPVTILIAHDKTVLTEWAGIKDPADIEAYLQELIALQG